MMIFGRKIHVGLDIGAYSLQWAALDFRSNKGEVWRAALSVGETADKHAPSFPETVQSLLKQCEQQSSLWSKTVVLGMQGAGVVSGYLEFPVLHEDELEMAVLSSVSREIPFPIDTMDVVHLPVTSLTENRTAVFYSVWPKAEVQRLTSICELCDLRIRRIEATGIGLTRELYRNRILQPDRFYSVVNMGHEITQVIMVQNGYPYYLRDIPVGGKDMTEAISLRRKLSLVEAEARKEQTPIRELIPSLGAVLSELSYELSRTFKYFQRRFKVDKVEKIFLSGGASLLQDYGPWLESELEMAVVAEGWDQFKPQELAGLAPLNKVALGLALGK
jgi:type IV pilus assembly protein PilM